MTGENTEVKLLLTGDTPGSSDGSRMRVLNYDIVADGMRVGTCELRPETTWTTGLNGHIAYTVFPPCRGHRYGAQALRLLCAEAKAMGMNGLTLTCRPENTASRRTLELAGAVFERIAPVPPEHPLHQSGIHEVCVYHIDIEEVT